MSLVWLDFWGRRLGIPYREYACMPLGMLMDLISVFLISEGIAHEKESGFMESYVPDWR